MPLLPVPAEWAPQAALWVGWPRLPQEWRGLIEPARDEIAGFVRSAAAFVPVRLAIGDAAAAAAARARGLDGMADLVDVPTGDIWLRDTGPLFVPTAEGLVAHAFRFNGWGGKYMMPGDAQTAMALSGMERAMPRQHDVVLEGGAVDFDGAGTVLTTRDCLLNPNRNGRLDEAGAEAFLARTVGARRVIWLDLGLVNDHTDGHVDNIARFAGPGHAVCQTPSGADDPHRERLEAAEAALRAAGLKVSLIPSPGRVTDQDGEVLPASHMNYVITNRAVIVPTYDSARTDALAAALSDAYPHRRIVPLPAGNILAGGGGAFHCMTREVPRGAMGATA